MKRITLSAVSASLALALIAPALAGTNTSLSTSVSSHIRTRSSIIIATNGTGSTVNGKKKVDPVCMQAAIEKRDNAIIAALDPYAAAWKANLGKRRDDLKAAWALTEKKARKEALKKAWKTFRESQKTARKAFKEARKGAWKTFRSEAKACKDPTADIEGEASDMD